MAPDFSSKWHTVIHCTIKQTPRANRLIVRISQIPYLCGFRNAHLMHKRYRKNLTCLKKRRKKKKHCIENPYIKSRVDRRFSLRYCTKIIPEGLHVCCYARAVCEFTDIFNHWGGPFSRKKTNNKRSIQVSWTLFTSEPALWKWTNHVISRFNTSMAWNEETDYGDMGKEELYFNSNNQSVIHCA